jgi:D-alanyl-D-alanine dipeptidase
MTDIGVHFMQGLIMQRNNKRTSCFVKAIMLLALSTYQAQDGRAQSITIVANTKIYGASVRRDPVKRMVELHHISPGLLYDLRYATKNNFTGQVLYPQNGITYMRYTAAKSLSLVQDSLKKLNLGLKIFDAYRPHAATRLMWDLIHDERYVADPSKGSGHNRGLAVDLTIVDVKNGKELDMGTAFDNFTDSAHIDFISANPDVNNNRKLLRSLMTHFGFVALPTEWWHYSWPNDHDYEVLDLSFRQLKKME